MPIRIRGHVVYPKREPAPPPQARRIGCNPRAWSDDDNAYLEANVGSKSWAEIGAILGRSASATEAHWQDLNRRRRMRGAA
jgi:hypothetical protein